MGRGPPVDRIRRGVAWACRRVGHHHTMTLLRPRNPCRLWVCRCRHDLIDAVILAGDPLSPPRTLRRLGRCGNPAVVAAMVPNPARPRRALRAAAAADTATRAAAASVHCLAPQTFRRLAADPDPAVRAAVAANLATPPDLLERLSRDPHEHVRMSVATSPAAPAAAFEVFAAHPDPGLRMLAAANIAAPTAVLARLAEDPDASVAAAAQAHPLAGADDEGMGDDRDTGEYRDLDAGGLSSGRLIARGTTPSSRCVETLYRASNGADFLFRIEPEPSGSGWRVVVPDLPDYGHRRADSVSTHLYEMHTTTPYICWSAPMPDPRAAAEVAALWAEATIVYIRTGRFAVPEDRPEVAIAPDTLLAEFLQRHT